MKKIVLMGNPNVGKSVVFSRLTGADVIVSNYPGTTIDFTKGKLRLDEREIAEIIDAPGTYSLEPSNKAEEVSAKIFKEADLVVNVVDSTNLERNLFLTLELLETKKPMIIALNMWDEARHKGIRIDVKKLEGILKVPIVPTIALAGEGIKELINRLKEAKSQEDIKPTTDDTRWMKIGSITKKVQEVEHRHHTLTDKISEASIKPVTGLPIAIVIILLSFWIVRFIGENIIGYVCEPLFEFYAPIAMGMSSYLGEGFLHDVLIGKLIDGEIDYVQSMGMLTTGLFVPFCMVLPYIITFYIVLGILEDSGYLPRLSTLVDNVFHKLGMHGVGVIPVFLGLGCNVPGALSSRILETRKPRFISATLMAMAVPCMAKTAMIFGILGPYGLPYLLIVFGVLFAIYIIGGLVLNKIVKGESPEIFLEIPPYRLPSARALLKKTWMRVRWFLTDAIPWLFFGVFIINILYAIGFLELLAKIFSPVMHTLFGLPGEATLALLIGFLRKDLAVGMLLTMGLNTMQITIAVTILAIYFPCVATFAVLVKELGIRDMVKSTAFMISTATIVGFILKVVFIGLV